MIAQCRLPIPTPKIQILQMSEVPSLAQLKAGAEAPDFTLPAHTGNDVTLSGYRGVKNVLLAFHPASFTGG